MESKNPPPKLYYITTLIKAFKMKGPNSAKEHLIHNMQVKKSIKYIGNNNCKEIKSSTCEKINNVTSSR